MPYATLPSSLTDTSLKYQKESRCGQKKIYGDIIMAKIFPNDYKPTNPKGHPTSR